MLILTAVVTVVLLLTGFPMMLPLLAAALIRPLSPATQQHTPSLLENVAVINIGLRSFALELQSASKPVVHYQWSPVAGGNKKLARLLERLQ